MWQGGNSSSYDYLRTTGKSVRICTIFSTPHWEAMSWSSIVWLRVRLRLTTSSSRRVSSATGSAWLPRPPVTLPPVRIVVHVLQNQLPFGTSGRGGCKHAIWVPWSHPCLFSSPQMSMVSHPVCWWHTSHATPANVVSLVISGVADNGFLGWLLQRPVIASGVSGQPNMARPTRPNRLTLGALQICRETCKDPARSTIQ